MRLYNKHKLFITIMIATIILVITQFFINNKLLMMQNELDDLNKVDSSNNFEDSLLNTLKSVTYLSPDDPLSLKDHINSEDALNLEKDPTLGDKIKSIQKNMCWLNIVNGFIITIEMFVVSILTSMVLISKDAPLFKLETKQVGDKEVTVFRAFPKDFKEVATDVMYMTKGVSGFKRRKAWVPEFITNLFVSNKASVYAEYDHVDTPRYTKNVPKSSLYGLPPVNENKQY